VKRRLSIGMRLAAMVGALTLTSAPVAAAAESDGAALVSLDGVTYSSSPSGSVFPGTLTLIPGTSHTGTFYVRNDSDRAGELRIAVSDTTTANAAFVENLSLRAVTPVTPDAPAVDLEPGATCMPLLDGEVMQPQTVTEVSITLAMRDSVDNAHQGATADTTLSVSLSEPGAPSTAADCTPGGGIPLTPDPEKPAVDGDSGDTDDQAGSGPGGNDQGGMKQPSENSAGGSGETPAPTTDTPVGAAAPPGIGAGSPVLFPWMGVGAVVLGGGAFFGLRKWKEHRR
jgi:hypothetical protein